MENENLVIAIEGMDGVGKTTIAKRVAEDYNFKYIEKPLAYILDTKSLSGKKNLDEILSQLNSMVSGWYKKILDLAENNWNEEEANKIGENYLDPQKLTKIFENIRIEKIRFGRRLMHLDKDLMKLMRV